MFDINFILNGKKKKTSSGSALISGKNIDFPAFFPDKKLMFSKKTYPQKSFLRNTSGAQSNRFFDNDKDGVVNGLDCFPFNSKKHSNYPMTPFQQEQNLREAYKFFSKPNEINDYLGMRMNFPSSKMSFNEESMVKMKESDLLRGGGGWKVDIQGTKRKYKLADIDDIEPSEEVSEKNRGKIDSIKLSGDIQKPIKVHNKNEPGQKYQIYDGHHRWVAALERGDKNIPVEIVENPKSHKSTLDYQQPDWYVESVAKSAAKRLHETEDGVCQGRCGEISSYLKKKFPNSTVIKSSPLSDIGAEHRALKLRNGKIIDTQKWQHYEKEPGDVSKRKVMFTPEEYSEYYDVGGGGEKIYSIRPFREKFADKIIPTDLDKDYYGDEAGSSGHMSGRGTGWFGSGIYGFATKEQAEAALKRAEESPVGRIYGYVREFEIKKPLKLDSDWKSETLHTASKKMYHYGTKAPKNDFMGPAKWEFERVGIKVTDKEIQDALKHTNAAQPINRLLKKKGYDGVIPSTNYQNTSYGSVKHYSTPNQIPLDENKAWSSEDKERKKLFEKAQFEQAKYEQENNENKFYDKLAEIQDRPFPITGRIFHKKDGSEEIVDYNEEQKKDEAKKYYGEETYTAAENIKESMKKIGGGAAKWKQLIRQGKDDGFFQYAKDMPIKEKFKSFKDNVLEYQRPFNSDKYPMFRDDEFRQERYSEPLKLMTMTRGERALWRLQKQEDSRREREAEDMYARKEQQKWSNLYDAMEAIEDDYAENTPFSFEQTEQPSFDEKYKELEDATDMTGYNPIRKKGGGQALPTFSPYTSPQSLLKSQPTWASQSSTCKYVPSPAPKPVEPRQLNPAEQANKLIRERMNSQNPKVNITKVYESAPKKINSLSDLSNLSSQLKGKTTQETVQNTIAFVKKTTPNYKFSYYPQDPVQAYNQRTADCTEIARISKHLFDQNNITSRISHGYVSYGGGEQPEKHDYVEVKIDGKWYPADGGTWSIRQRYGEGIW
jgi:hypothetical protein